jgi:hypothetical protein
VGAGQLVTGELVRHGSRVTISATLRAVAAPRRRIDVSVEGWPDSLAPLVDRLAGRLLARAAGEPDRRLAALEAAPAAALRAYLDGWVLVRQGRQDEALTKFHAALAADSTFALAALGACRALEERGIGPAAPEVRLARRLRGLLTPADRAYLDVMIGPRYPEWSSQLDHLKAAERFVRLDPGNADAWNAYAIFLCPKQAGQPEIDRRCRAAYRRALALDSTFSGITYNAALWDAFLWEDTANLRRSLRLFRQQDSTSPGSRVLQWIAATTLGDTLVARREALSDSLVSVGADGNLGPIWQMLSYYFSEGRGFGDIELVLQRSQAISPTASQRATLETMRFQLAVMRGSADRLTSPSWWSGSYLDYQRVADALFADADPALAGPSAAALERQVGSPVVGGCCLERFAASQSALAGGRIAIARRALADMERYRTSVEGRTDGSGESRVWPLIVAAQITARDRSPDAGARLLRLDSALVESGSDWTMSLVYGNLISARLHEARREYGAALAALRRRDSSWSSPALVTYHREEGRLAALAGDTAGAVRAYRRYLRIRDDVEPRLQPQVARVRRALAALLSS